MSADHPPVRVGVVGFGQWGPNHVRNFSQMEGVEVVRVCDASEARRTAAQRFIRGLAVTGDTAAITPSLTAMAAASEGSRVVA